MKKTHKIIMLPTEEATFLVDGATDGIFYITEGPDKSKLKGDTNVHLYILSDEKIKEGYWAYHKVTKNVIQSYQDGSLYGDWKKIIATTNPKLTKVDEVSGDNVWTSPIPQVPQPLVEYYAKHQPEEVELEYEKPYSNGRPDLVDYELKLQNNEVVWVEHSLKDGLKKVIDRIDGMIGDKTKRYTREEVEKLCKSAWLHGMRTEGEKFSDWKKKNL